MPPAPVLGHHLVQHLGLRGVTEHVLAQPLLPLEGFLPEMFESACPRPDPDTPATKS